MWTQKREREADKYPNISWAERERDWEKRGGDEARQQETPLLFLPTQLPFLFPQYALSVNKPQKLKMILFQTSLLPLPLASQHEYNFRGEEKKRQEGREFSRSQTFWGKLWDVGANSIGTECSLSLFAWRWKKNSKAEKDFLKDGISDPERKEGDRKSKWKKEKRVRFLSFPSEQKVGGIWALVY